MYNLLDRNSENYNYIPQSLDLRDTGLSFLNFIKDLNFSLQYEDGSIRAVPVIFLSQELWAERKLNWKYMRNEQGQEVTRPFIVVARTGVKMGTSPLKRVIPEKKKFKYIKVPTFDGTSKGYALYKIPQPVYVDQMYDLMFVSHYMTDVNLFYEKIFRDVYSARQAYLKVNGYDIMSVLEDPTEDNDIDETKSEKIYQINFPIIIHGKLVNSADFEKVNTIKKISVKISEF